MNPFFWNLGTLALLLLCIWGVWRLRQQSLWAEAWRRLRRNGLAMVSLTVISLYFMIGVLDSIAWKDSKAADPRTVIDRIYRPTQEHTYSAPLSRRTTGEPRPRPLVG